MPKKMNIALLVHTATSWGHQVLEGVARYSKKQEHWRILHEHGRGTREALRLPPDWKVDGIIASLQDPHIIEHVQNYEVPVVNLSSVYLEGTDGFPRVCEDVERIGIVAVEHFVNLGFKHFAYYGSFRDGLYVSLRDTFEKAVKANQGDFSCHPIFELRSGSRKNSRDSVGLKDWLDLLAKPVCVFTWSLESAGELSDACRELGILIPEQVSILAVDAVNNPVCEIADPPLSCVAIDATGIGYEAARLLDSILHQKQEGTAFESSMKPLLIPPIGIDVRRSTETLAIENEHVAKGVSFIRDHALEPITVADVVKHVSISRPRIEILFRQYLNRSPAEEIRRIRLARAEELLRETTLSIPEVAEASGFTSPEYLARVFKTAKGVTPLKYRKG